MRLLVLSFLLLTGCSKSTSTPLGDDSGGEPMPESRIRESHRLDGVLMELGTAKVEGDRLNVSFLVTNQDAKKSLEFKSWGGSGATARDDAGNSYTGQAVDVGTESRLERALQKKGDRIGLGSGPLVADRPRLDVIAFDRPPPAATQLVVTLSGANFGSPNKSSQFTVTRAMWAK